MVDNLPGHFRIDVPTDLVYVRPVRKMIEAVLKSEDWSEDDVDDTALVVTEVVQNAIEHGSLCDGKERVTVVCRVETLAVELDVEDPGTGKDPAELLRRDVTAPVPIEATRGRGLFLIHRLCSRLERQRLATGRIQVCVRRERGEDA